MRPLVITFTLQPIVFGCLPLLEKCEGVQLFHVARNHWSHMRAAIGLACCANKASTLLGACFVGDFTFVSKIVKAQLLHARYTFDESQSATMRGSKFSFLNNSLAFMCNAVLLASF